MIVFFRGACYRDVPITSFSNDRIVVAKWSLLNLILASPVRIAMAGADVVIVGGGLMGGVAAAAAAGKGLRVRVLDAGLNRGNCFGEHLSIDPRMSFASPARDRLTNGLLLPIQTQVAGKRLDSFSVGLGGGGAGLLWNGICERLDARTPEGRRFIDSCVSSGYAEAERRLSVIDSIDQLSALGGLPLRPLRIAARKREHFVATPGPKELLGGSQRVELSSGCVVKRLHHQGGIVKYVEAVDVVQRQFQTFSADSFIIAADAIRSPSLLAASGIRPEPGFPVGKWLGDHPLAIAKINPTTPEGLALAGALSAAPHHTGCSGAVFDQASPAGTRMILSSPGSSELSLYWYGVGHPNPSNRLEFTETDPGFGWDGTVVQIEEKITPDEERAWMMDDLVEAVGRWGEARKGWKPRWLSIGSAYHYFGTLRSTASSADDGVTDFDGRVFGFSNLYVAGSARFPAPTSASPTLAAIAATLQTVSRL
jgi:hypothetical protein